MLNRFALDPPVNMNLGLYRLPRTEQRDDIWPVGLVDLDGFVHIAPRSIDVAERVYVAGR